MRVCSRRDLELFEEGSGFEFDVAAGHRQDHDAVGVENLREHLHGRPRTEHLDPEDLCGAGEGGLSLR